jgi:hypothetical protein
MNSTFQNACRTIAMTGSMTRITCPLGVGYLPI